MTDLILTGVGTAVTVGSFVYAVKTNREKAKLERLVWGQWKGIDNNVNQVREVASKASMQMSSVVEKMEKLEDSEDLRSLRKAVILARKDASNSAHMIKLLVQQVLALGPALDPSYDELPDVGADSDDS